MDTSELVQQHPQHEQFYGPEAYDKGQALAAHYARHGHFYGEVEELGDGPPSAAGLSTVGFAWPAGTIAVFGNNRMKFTADKAITLDRQARG